jgi:peptide chain release factor subunit 1
VITVERVRELAGQRHQPVVTSLYLDVDGRRNPRPVDYKRHLTTLRKQVEERIEGEAKPPHAYRMSVRGDLERIRQFVCEDFDREGPVRGLALFSCSAERWFEVVELPFDVGDQAALDQRPRVRQLEMGLAEQRTYGVALVDRRRIRIFVSTPERFAEVGEKYEDLRSRAERGGWNGPKIQHHADEIAHRHFRDFAAVLRDTLAAHPVDELFVGATDEDLAEFSGELDHQVEPLITGRVNAGTTAPVEEIREATAHAVEERTRQRRAQLLDRLGAAVNGEEPAAVGLGPVLEALMMRRVELMLVDEDHTAPGRRCPKCETLALDAAECPACGTPTDAVEDMVDEAVVRALGEDAPAYGYDAEQMAGFRQIGAILRW